MVHNTASLTDCRSSACSAVPEMAPRRTLRELQGERNQAYEVSPPEMFSLTMDEQMALIWRH